MTGLVHRLFLTVAIVLFGIGAAAEQRIALVVGNGAYQRVTELDNPVPDAALIAQTLEGLEFQVTLVTDVDLDTLKRAVADFGRDLRAAGRDATGLFYYAGHGVQSFGSNYLLPVDTMLTDAADLDLAAVEASSILRQMSSARNRTNIFILDACRNNPFENVPGINDTGLAEMKAPTGTYLAYATAPGAVALDGNGTNSPFTTALAVEMTADGAPIEQVFKQVRVRVIEATGGAQTPWDSSSLTSEFQFAEAVLPSPQERAETIMWDTVRATRDPLQIILFLRTYPDGIHASAARGLLTATVAEEVQADGNIVSVAPPAAPPPVVQPEASETAMLEAARTSGTEAGYLAYLDAYPTGVFAELARVELGLLREQVQAAAQTPPPAPVPTDPPAQVAAAVPQTPVPVAGPVTFTLPLTSATPEISGRTIAELITGSPLFPPVEGLPDSYWKEQRCSNCHEWKRDNLCVQAQSYTTVNAERALSKDHPYGGGFKRALRSWAEGGCQ